MSASREKPVPTKAAPSTLEDLVCVSTCWTQNLPRLVASLTLLLEDGRISAPDAAPASKRKVLILLILLILILMAFFIIIGEKNEAEQIHS